MGTDAAYSVAKIERKPSVRHGALLWNTGKVTINTLHLRQHGQHFSTLTKSNKGADMCEAEVFKVIGEEIMPWVAVIVLYWVLFRGN